MCRCSRPTTRCSRHGPPYTWREYRETVAAARRRLPGLALSTDLIVGFPTEDDEAFARSLAAVGPGAGLFARVHVFSLFAAGRDGGGGAGAACGHDGQARALLAREAAAAARSAAAAASLDTPARVLLKEYRDGEWRGYSSTYVRYYLRGVAARGRLVDAVADALHRDGVVRSDHVIRQEGALEVRIKADTVVGSEGRRQAAHAGPAGAA